MLWLKSIFAVFTTWNLAATDHKIHAKGRIVKRTHRTFTFQTDVADLNEVYVSPTALARFVIVKQVSSDAAHSTSVTLHDLLMICALIAIFTRVEIALRIAPCYVETEPGCCCLCNVDDTTSWTSVKRDDLIVVCFVETCSKIIVACKIHAHNVCISNIWGSSPHILRQWTV